MSKLQQKLEGSNFKCPHCGFQLVTQEEAKQLLAALNKMKGFYQSSLDMSPDGLKSIITYVDNVMEALTSYQNILTSFFEQHKAAMKKPKLFQDKQWDANMMMLLMGMFSVWNRPEFKTFSLEIIVKPPSGCQNIDFELMKIRDLTNSFVSDYGSFIDQTDADGLEKSKKSIAEIPGRLDKALSEIDKVRQQIVPKKKS